MANRLKNELAEGSKIHVDKVSEMVVEEGNHFKKAIFEVGEFFSFIQENTYIHIICTLLYTC